MVILSKSIITTFMCGDNQKLFPQARKMTYFKTLDKSQTEWKRNVLIGFQQKHVETIDVKVTNEVLGQGRSKREYCQRRTSKDGYYIRGDVMQTTLIGDNERVIR